jgi:CHAT domain-containing protein
MRKFAFLCLWVFMVTLATAPAWAVVPNPAQTGDVPEAKAASDQAEILFKAGKYQEARPLAEEALWKREKALGPEHPLTAASLTQAANIYLALHKLNTGGWQAARHLSFYRRALKIRERALGPEAPETATSLADVAVVYLWYGDYGQGLPLAQRSLKIREKVFGPEAPETAASLNLLARFYGQMGAMDQALAQARRALDIQEKKLGPEHVETAQSLETLAILHKQRGSPSQALDLARRSLKIREKVLGPDNLETMESLGILGLVYLGLKDHGQAESYFRRVPTFNGKLGLVTVYLATGRYEAALTLLSATVPGSLTPPQERAQYYIQKGRALQLGPGQVMLSTPQRAVMGGSGGKENLAFQAYEEAIDIIEEMRARTPGQRTGFFEAGATTGYSQAYREVVGILAVKAQRGDPIPSASELRGTEPVAAAFFMAESIKARALLEAMATEASRALSRRLPSDLASREKSLQARLEALEAKRGEILMADPERTVGSNRDREAPTLLKLEREALLKEQQGLAAELRRRDPQLAALLYPQPLNARELPLKSGEVLLEYVLGEKESYLFRVEPGGKTQVFRLPFGQEALERRLGAMLAPFRQNVLRREDLSRFAVSDAATLYQDLLAPALSGVNPGTRLIIVPDGALGAFPFEALVVRTGPDWGKCTLVGDQWPVTYAQSASILALARHLGASHAPQALFALGDCIYTKDSSRYLAYKAGKEKAGELKSAGPEKSMTMAATDRGWGRLQFSPLPETRQTVLELAGLFQEKPQPPQVLLDVYATETRVRHEKLGQYRYLFFGTHGFLADKIAGVQEPTLVLTQVENKPPDDGFLTFSKVLQLKLDAELVTLAACMTGVGQVMQGEGVLNFARAFQQAGARSVMVSLWNIPVDESMKFYSAFYKALKEGKPKIEALKVARQAVRAKESHPYFWSGLILHGEG